MRRPLTCSLTKVVCFQVNANVDVEELTRRTENYSGAEVNAVCHEAALAALEEDIHSSTVEMRHFMLALDMLPPRTPQCLVNLYEEYLNNNEY